MSQIKAHVPARLVTYTETETSRKYQFKYAYEIKAWSKEYTFVKASAAVTKIPIPNTVTSMVFCWIGIWSFRSRATETMRTIRC